jgi:hypothetical protein
MSNCQNSIRQYKENPCTTSINSLIYKPQRNSSYENPELRMSKSPSWQTTKNRLRSTISISTQYQSIHSYTTCKETAYIKSRNSEFPNRRTDKQPKVDYVAEPASRHSTNQFIHIQLVQKHRIRNSPNRHLPIIHIAKQKIVSIHYNEKQNFRMSKSYMQKFAWNCKPVEEKARQAPNALPEKDEFPRHDFLSLFAEANVIIRSKWAWNRRSNKFSLKQFMNLHCIWLVNSGCIRNIREQLQASQDISICSQRNQRDVCENIFAIQRYQTKL